MDNLLTTEEICYLDELEYREPERAKLERDALIKKRLDMKTVMSTEAGRNIIWDIMSSCGIFSVSHTGNSQTYFKEGRRAVGLEVMSEVMAADPNGWIELQREKLVEIQKTLNESER